MSTLSKQVKAVSAADFDVERIREDFPVLKQNIHGKPLVYLDSAATAQKPFAVIDAIRRFHEVDCANIHRGVHELSQRSTAAYEETRAKAKRFLNARSKDQLIFVRGTTEGINLVSNSWGRPNVKAGDEIIISAMEHHSNIVPWQMLCEEKGAKLRVIPMNERGELLMEEYEKLLNPRTRMVAVTHVSNALGTINPVKQIIDMAHAAGALTLIDGAQAAPHMTGGRAGARRRFLHLQRPQGVRPHRHRHPLRQAQVAAQCHASLSGRRRHDQSGDFRKDHLRRPAVQVRSRHAQHRRRHRTGRRAGLRRPPGHRQAIAAYEHALLEYGTEALSRIPGLRLIGTAREKASVLSFVMEGIHPHDIGTLLDRQGIAVRTGHHCAQPVMDFFNVPATTRASLAFYNTFGEIDALVAGLQKVKEVFA